MLISIKTTTEEFTWEEDTFAAAWRSLNDKISQIKGKVLEALVVEVENLGTLDSDYRVIASARVIK